MRRNSANLVGGAGSKDGGHSTSPAMGVFAMIPEDLIVQNLLPRLDLTSRVRLAAVSKPWRAHSLLFPLPTQLPWLFGGILPDSTLTLLNLNIGRPAPSIHSPRRPSVSEFDRPLKYVGIVDGNAIIAPSSGGVLLYNPFYGETSRVVQMNPPAYSDIERVRILPEQGLVVASNGDSVTLSACRLGQSDWVELNCMECVSDFIFHNDKLFCVSFYGNIYSFDLQDSSTNHRVVIATTLYHHDLDPNNQPDFDDFHFHLVDSCGDLLVVVESCRENYKSEFLVYKVELDEQRTSASLKPVNDLADRMLFVGETCSVSCPLPSDLLKSFAKNCIYYIHYEIRSRISHFKIGKWVLNSGGFCNHFPFKIPRFSFRPVWITPHPHLRSV